MKNMSIPRISRVPRIRDLVQHDIFDTADWFLRYQFKVKNAKSLTATRPIYDEDGNKFGFITELYPEFTALLFMAAGWRTIADRGNYALCLVKDYEGYRAHVGLGVTGQDNEYTVIERLEV